MPLEDLALATVDEVAPTHARVHWPVVALQGTELAGLDDQVEYQVLAREVSLPGRAAARRCRWATATGRWSAPGAAPTARRATGGCGSTRPRPHGGALQPGHRYEWKVRARLSGAGYLFGQSDGQPHGRPGGRPGPAHGEPGGPHRLRVAWLRQALAEDDARRRERPVAELAGDGHTTALDVIALPAELGTELAGLDDQVEYQVLAREVSLPGRAAARRCRWATATGRWSAPRAAPNGTAGDWWMRPGHRYEWKVRARLSGAGYLFGQSDAGSPTAAPEDVESSPTAETVLPEQDLGQPTRRRERPVAELAGDGHTTALDVIALPAELNGTYSWVDSESYSPETAASWEMPLEDLALATVDEVAPTHARVHWPVVALQGTELAGLDDQVEYQVLAREVSLPGRAAARRCRWATATGRWSAPRGRPQRHGGRLPGHRYEWKVRARLSGAGYLFGQSDAGSPTAAPEDVESSPTAETVVLPEQDLGQPTRQALAEDDAVTGPGVRYHVGPVHQLRGQPGGGAADGGHERRRERPRGRAGGRRAHDGPGCDCPAGRAASRTARDGGQLGDALEDLALATVDEVAPTHARVHWPVVALQGTELAGLDDQVEYQVLAREVSLPGAGGGAPVPVGDGNWTVVSAPGAAPNGTAGDWWMRPGHRYEWKVRARLSGAGYLFGQSDAGSPTAAPEDVESSPTAETVVLPEQDLGQPTVSLVGPHRLRVAWLRQALAEDDAVTGPGVRYHVWARCTSCAGSPAAVRLTGATSADASAPNGTYSWVDSESYSPETAASWEMPLEDLALATVDEVAPTHARVHWPVVALQGTELAGLDDQVEYQVLAREVSLPGAGGGAPVPVGDGNWTVVSAPGAAPNGTAGDWWMRVDAATAPTAGALQPGHRYEWKVRARLSGAGYRLADTDVLSAPTPSLLLPLSTLEPLNLTLISLSTLSFALTPPLPNATFHYSLYLSTSSSLTLLARTTNTSFNILLPPDLGLAAILVNVSYADTSYDFHLHSAVHPIYGASSELTLLSRAIRNETFLDLSWAAPLPFSLAPNGTILYSVLLIPLPSPFIPSLPAPLTFTINSTSLTISPLRPSLTYNLTITTISLPSPYAFNSSLGPLALTFPPAAIALTESALLWPNASVLPPPTHLTSTPFAFSFNARDTRGFPVACGSYNSSIFAAFNLSLPGVALTNTSLTCGPAPDSPFLFTFTPHTARATNLSLTFHGAHIGPSPVPLVILPRQPTIGTTTAVFSPADQPAYAVGRPMTIFVDARDLDGNLIDCSQYPEYATSFSASFANSSNVTRTCLGTRYALTIVPTTVATRQVLVVTYSGDPLAQADLYSSTTLCTADDHCRALGDPAATCALSVPDGNPELTTAQCRCSTLYFGGSLCRVVPIDAMSSSAMYPTSAVAGEAIVLPMLVVMPANVTLANRARGGSSHATNTVRVSCASAHLGHFVLRAALLDATGAPVADGEIAGAVNCDGESFVGSLRITHSANYSMLLSYDGDDLVGSPAPLVVTPAAASAPHTRGSYPTAMTARVESLVPLFPLDSFNNSVPCKPSLLATMGLTLVDNAGTAVATATLVCAPDQVAVVQAQVKPAKAGTFRYRVLLNGTECADSGQLVLVAENPVDVAAAQTTLIVLTSVLTPLLIGGLLIILVLAAYRRRQKKKKEEEERQAAARAAAAAKAHAPATPPPAPADEKPALDQAAGRPRTLATLEAMRQTMKDLQAGGGPANAEQPQMNAILQRLLTQLAEIDGDLRHEGGLAPGELPPLPGATQPRDVELGAAVPVMPYLMPGLMPLAPEPPLMPPSMPALPLTPVMPMPPQPMPWEGSANMAMAMASAVSSPQPSIALSLPPMADLTAYNPQHTPAAWGATPPPPISQSPPIPRPPRYANRRVGPPVHSQRMAANASRTSPVPMAEPVSMWPQLHPVAVTRPTGAEDLAAAAPPAWPAAVNLVPPRVSPVTLFPGLGIDNLDAAEPLPPLRGLGGGSVAAALDEDPAALFPPLPSPYWEPPSAAASPAPPAGRAAPAPALGTGGFDLPVPVTPAYPQPAARRPTPPPNAPTRLRPAPRAAAPGSPTSFPLALDDLPPTLTTPLTRPVGGFQRVPPMPLQQPLQLQGSQASPPRLVAALSPPQPQQQSQTQQPPVPRVVQQQSPVRARESGEAAAQQPSPARMRQQQSPTRPRAGPPQPATPQQSGVMGLLPPMAPLPGELA
ncbi:hypothetical protein PAPYR_11117 [Paratrimastix pyriformis]|uniref:Fibronectin type-III domain-containing protein n=1 Tax=Paratrimastix pyriformis TaxID=342808 RepID=A0ABQ8U8D3_9EUKA|nr:hypothetical protein PAPYR_11117 [Paratrimastix pyriformis]